MTRSWHLENVEDAARVSPRSFFIPSEKSRSTQSVGSAVRLHFLLADPGPDDPRAERMWVDISAVHGSPPRYTGRLDNQPKYIRDLHIGDLVEFGPEHIAQAVITRTDPRWLDIAELGALVSARVFESGECVRWMYRTTADRPQDSGWRLYTGTESDEEANDASRIRICNVGWLVDFDPTLVLPFRAAVGAAFERVAYDAAWVPVHDWAPPTE